MESVPQPNDPADPVSSAFAAAWSKGETPRAEEILEQSTAGNRAELLPQLLACEIAQRRQRGETPSVAEYSSRFPDQRQLVDRLFADQPASHSPQSAVSRSAGSPIKDEGATETWKGSDGSRTDPVGQLPTIPGYEIIQLLGQGGMGYVVQARDLKLNRLVALKLPLPEKLRDAADRERFMREARSAARLRHHGICPIYEIGEAAGQPYLALAFIAGQPLSTWATAKPPTARQAAEIVSAVAEAVQEAHEHGVVHRDLKPGNVMIDQATGAPILMDFGLAKDQSEADIHLTYDGAILGTPAYMSPEQAVGAVDQVGRCSDVYGLGAMLYWLLCRRPPFAGTFGEVLRLVQTAEPTPPCKLHPGLHRDLETICLKAMAKEPRDRYASAQALAADLRRFTIGEAILARPEGALGKLWRMVRRRPSVTVAVLAIAVVLAVASVIAQQASHDRQVTLTTQRFDRNLEDEAWTPARYEQLEAQIQGIMQLDPEEARKAHDRLSRRFREHLQQAIQRPSLSPDDLDKIRFELDFYTTRNVSAASELKQELEQRLRAWTTVFDLSPPYANLPTVFAPPLVQQTGERLVAQASDGPPPGADANKTDVRDPTLVPSLVASGGNVELKATFTDAALDKSQRLGVMFNLAGKQGYQFVLAIAPRVKVNVAEATGVEMPAEDPPLVGTLGKELGAGRQIELQIIRNGLVVRRQLAHLPCIRFHWIWHFGNAAFNSLIPTAVTLVRRRPSDSRFVRTARCLIRTNSIVAIGTCGSGWDSDLVSLPRSKPEQSCRVTE